MDIDGSNRPSLVAGSGRGAPASGHPGRILADMENRRPAPARAAAGNRARRTRVLLAGGVLVIVLVLVAAARVLAPGAADPWHDYGEQTVVQADPPAQAAVIEPAKRPALIIDAAAARPDDAARNNPLARIQPAAAGDHVVPVAANVHDAGAVRVETARSASATAPVATGAKATRTSGAARAANAPRAESTDADGGLLATLLGIIRHEPSAGPTPTERELQACPAANTVQGIYCRDRICARWAGRDPACPPR